MTSLKVLRAVIALSVTSLLFTGCANNPIQTAFAQYISKEDTQDAKVDKCTKERVTDVDQTALLTSFAKHNHFTGGSFFNTPDGERVSDPSRYLSNNFESLRPLLVRASDDDLVKLLRTYPPLGFDAAGTQGSETFGKLGFFVDSRVDSSIKKANKAQHGVVVVRTVFPNSLADKAGIKTGDVITHFDGYQIDNEAEMRERIETLNYEIPARAKVLRDNHSIDVSIDVSTLAKTKTKSSGCEPLTPAGLGPAHYKYVSDLWFSKRIASSGGDPDKLPLSNMITILKDADRDGLDTSVLPRNWLKVVAVTSTDVGNVEFQSDLLKVGQIMPGEVEGLAAGDEEKYKIILSPSQPEIIHSIDSKRTVDSKYVAGYDEVLNPDYDRTKLAIIQTQLELNNAQSQYCYGMGCAGKLILVAAISSRLNELQSQLSRTSMTVKQPVYRPYTYDVAKISVKKNIDYELYTVSPDNKITKKPMRTSENKVFEVLYNVHESDAGGAKGVGATEEDIKAYESQPVQIALDDVLDDLGDSTIGTHKVSSFAMLNSEITKRAMNAVVIKKNVGAGGVQPKISTDPRFDSVVIVTTPADALGSGFFVTPHHIITNSHVVEGSDFVSIQTHGGAIGTGKVVARDLSRDMALLSTSMTGQPVTFYSGEDAPVGDTVYAVGHPRGLAFSVTRGIVSAVRSIAISEVPSAPEVLVIQTDAPINAGNSGGPLYFGNKVIGVNTVKNVGTGVESLGFAVHASEVVIFMQQNGI